MNMYASIETEAAPEEPDVQVAAGQALVQQADAAPSTPPRTGVTAQGINRTVCDLTPSKTDPPNTWPDEQRDACMKKANAALLDIMSTKSGHNEEERASLHALCKANVLQECAVSVKKRMREIMAEEKAREEVQECPRCQARGFGEILYQGVRQERKTRVWAKLGGPWKLAKSYEATLQTSILTT